MPATPSVPVPVRAKSFGPSSISALVASAFVPRASAAPAPAGVTRSDPAVTAPVAAVVVPAVGLNWPRDSAVSAARPVASVAVAVAPARATPVTP